MVPDIILDVNSLNTFLRFC